jgi:NADPH-dependent 2,4-dienoyl-CoA reductase/sulfur reductase-like enzyme
MTQPRIIVAGVGFGGLAAAKALKSPAEIILIDRTNRHSFQPLLYQVATSALSPNQIAFPVPGNSPKPEKRDRHLADRESDRNIKDQTRPKTTTLAILDYRFQPTGKTVVHFEERPADQTSESATQ